MTCEQVGALWREYLLSQQQAYMWALVARYYGRAGLWRWWAACMQMVCLSERMYLLWRGVMELHGILCPSFALRVNPDGSHTMLPKPCDPPDDHQVVYPHEPRGPTPEENRLEILRQIYEADRLLGRF